MVVRSPWRKHNPPLESKAPARLAELCSVQLSPLSKEARVLFLSLRQVHSSAVGGKPAKCSWTSCMLGVHPSPQQGQKSWGLVVGSLVESPDRNMATQITDHHNN